MISNIENPKSEQASASRKHYENNKKFQKFQK